MTQLCVYLSNMLIKFGDAAYNRVESPLTKHEMIEKNAVIIWAGLSFFSHLDSQQGANC